MPARVNRRRPWRGWLRYDDERLLGLRFKDLELRLERSRLVPRIEQLYEELEAKGIAFRPHVWLSTEWFSPDGVPGIAIPFYLAHPRLMKLERKQMLEVEGGTSGTCMRILRHEAGHAIDTAYRLHYRKRWREAFGRYSQRYPDHYRPRPDSKRYVLHLDGWYAQAHPAEDFAETFAVWLTPRSRWRERYADWPVALKKLQTVKAMMAELAGRRPALRSRARVEHVGRVTETLREHYRRKRAHYTVDVPQSVDRDLRRIFSNDRRFAGRPTAASFLRELRDKILGKVSEWTGVPPYTIDQLLREMVERCRILKLRVALPPREARTEVVIMLTVHTINLLRTRRFEIPV